MLTLKALKEMKPGVFMKGVTVDDSTGCNMTGSGKDLKWVASRGDIHDWAIYVLFSDRSWEEVKSNGDKVYDEENIKKLVPCDNEAFEMYRY